MHTVEIDIDAGGQTPFVAVSQYNQGTHRAVLTVTVADTVFRLYDIPAGDIRAVLEAAVEQCERMGI